MTVNAILDQIRLMPREEQESIAETLFDELAVESDEESIPPLSPELRAEIDRRLAEYDADPSSGVPMEVVLRKLKARTP